MVGVDIGNSNLLLSDASLRIIFARELIDLLVSPTSKVLNEWFEVIMDLILLGLRKVYLGSWLMAEMLVDTIYKGSKRCLDVANSPEICLHNYTQRQSEEGRNSQLLPLSLS